MSRSTYMQPERWIPAGGPVQVPFMVAAGRRLKGAEPPCPACQHPQLRHYFHLFNAGSATGTFWVWCPKCGTHVQLPRVSAPVPAAFDPYAALSLDEFAALETSTSRRFLDLLNDLWETGGLTPRP